ncbi:hypothetical protein P2A78_20820 [Xanthomonas perforans]|uniref:Uncharacterized protein n=1 Tax=Xanthomonas hortorum pv. gardneri TaxID=2754056 RepID=A0A6V7FI57_9XANT|nr:MULTISPECIES: hypothetical protein [Xanthomonas]MBD1532307.1 hypothetical protein [Xanthomonas citri pv. citri]MBD4081497.1 hypothetical protein [Xanthomonas citri pv. citri]MBD4389260.1 hypothetical protein [Xanthomonas citri pv. citri]MBD4392475.1 hypothetical protein [Xanthomonas citri pv. citri]MBD4400185.1 hypothetical protein [Xanthomonas citri pv. citri]
MDSKTSSAVLILFVIGAVCGASLVLTAIHLTLGGAQADPKVLALGLAAGVLVLAGLGRAAFCAGHGLMDDVVNPNQDNSRK